MNDDYTAILLEDINHKFEAILEGQVLLAPMSQKLNNVDKRLVRVENYMKIMKKVLVGLSRESKHHAQRLDNHGKRLTRLEQPV
jgi:hypothetical protein